MGQEVKELLTVALPAVVLDSLLFAKHDVRRLEEHMLCVQEQESLRAQLASKGLLVFIADGSLLPRVSADCALRKRNSRPFKSSEHLRVELTSIKGGTISGMGIPKGITVLVGHSQHGKSMILEAVAHGIYNHVPGDGREFVVTEPTAVKICAQARVVTNVDIAPFFTECPGDGGIVHRANGRVSGSIAMAVNIQEALELSSRLLLIDEDESVSDLLCDNPTALLNRQQLITPLICKARCLLARHGTSTIIVRCGLDN